MKKTKNKTTKKVAAKSTDKKIPFKSKIFSPKAITRSVLVIAPSGRGKSHAIQNLDPKATLIVNTENKPLPFKKTEKFKKHIALSKTEPLDLFDIIKYAQKTDSVTTLCIDSFSGWSDYLLMYCKKNFTGHAVYGKYAEYVEQMFRTINKLVKREHPLNVIVTAHDDIVQNSDGEMVKSTKVKGKELRGQVERHFTVVAYGVAKFKEEGDGNEFSFLVQSDGVVPAKSPEGMFKDSLIPNDYQLIVDAMDKYWG